MNRQFLVSIVALGVCLGGVNARSAPEIEVKRIARPPAIDGRLDDLCWQTVPQITEFRCVDRNGAFPSQRTEAWIACGEDALFVAVRCHDDHIEQVQAVETGLDGRVWRDDCIEVFLMPGMPYYYHFGANLLGTRYDARHDVTGKDKAPPESWHADWRAAAQRGKDQWTMEISIPFACLQLGAARLAAPFGFNLGREQRRLTEFSCWPASGFNKHEEFAVLKNLVLEEQRYGIVVEEAAWGNRVAGPNEFTATVVEEAASAQDITLRATVKPLPEGEGKVYGSRGLSAAKTRWSIVYQAPMTGGVVQVVVEALDERGRARFAACNAFRVPPPVEASLDLPLLFISDGKVRLTGRVAVPASVLRKAKLEVALLSGDKVLFQSPVPIGGDGRFRVELPIGNVQPGDYCVEARLTVAEMTAQPVVTRFPFRVLRGPMD
ncbi:MAG: hypothetical protein HY318_04100 [Armatimonadetes bacterium]|nr:hypothetical protein [Armatimonadota bacterium]